MEMVETAITLQQQQSMLSRFKRICVFCGSSQGKKTSYQVAAIDLGNELVLFFPLLLFASAHCLAFFFSLLIQEKKK